jgi:hypothetical protein
MAPKTIFAQSELKGRGRGYWGISKIGDTSLCSTSKHWLEQFMEFKSESRTTVHGLSTFRGFSNDVQHTMVPTHWMRSSIPSKEEII